MKHLSRARLTNTVGKLFFLAAVLFAIYEYAVAIASVGKDAAAATAGFVFGSVSLVFGLFGAFLFYEVSVIFLSLAEAEIKKAEESWEGEDGLPAAFCREIRAYSPAQLRLIIDEQKSEYSEEEFAYIQKILTLKTQNNA